MLLVAPRFARPMRFVMRASPAWLALPVRSPVIPRQRRKTARAVVGRRFRGGIRCSAYSAA